MTATRVPGILSPGLLLALQAMLGTAIAQPPEPPPIGTIDFFGLRTIPVEQAMRVLPFEAGDRLPDGDPAPLAEATAAALGAARVEFNFVCCTDAGLMQIYVGVEETTSDATHYLAAPTGDIELPEEILASFDTFLERMLASVLSGNSREDRSQGHAFAEDVTVREVQESFVAYAAQYEGLLRDVLQGSANERHRAIAAHVLGYVEDKAAVAEALGRAVRDPSGEVRNYATRALAVIAEYAAANPASGVEIPADPFVDMLSSFVWSDRNKSLAVLASLTGDRDAGLLETLRARALPSLVEMCGWQHWGHAAPACAILRRMAGLPEAYEESSRARTLATVLSTSR